MVVSDTDGFSTDSDVQGTSSSSSFAGDAKTVLAHIAEKEATRMGEENLILRATVAELKQLTRARYCYCRVNKNKGMRMSV